MSERDTMRISITCSTGPETEDAEKERAFINFREELLNLDLENVSLERNLVAPPGTMGDGVTLGSLVVTTLPVVIPMLLDLVKDWCARRKGRRTSLEIEQIGRGKKLITITGTMSHDDFKRILQEIKIMHRK